MNFGLNIIFLARLWRKLAAYLNHSRVRFLDQPVLVSYGETWLWPWLGSNLRSLGREADTLTTRPRRPLCILIMFYLYFFVDITVYALPDAVPVSADITLVLGLLVTGLPVTVLVSYTRLHTHWWLYWKHLSQVNMNLIYTYKEWYKGICSLIVQMIKKKCLVYLWKQLFAR